MPVTSERPTAFLLPGLGLSGRLFDSVIAALGDAVVAVPVDLPGFGSAAGAADSSVVGTVAAVERRIAQHLSEHGASRWLLVGHSMGGKIATIVAARTLSGEAPLFGLAGVVLLAASPPGPEPMDDDQRAEMLGWGTPGPLDDAAARAFLDGNVTSPLTVDLDGQTHGDVRRSAPAAWRAWLSHGSREDWSTTVGTLDVPAAILAGADDPALGEEAQRRLNAPIYPRARVTVLPGARHLLPLEKPAEVAAAIAEVADLASRGPATPPRTAALIASTRVSRRTRSALARRSLPDDPDYRPQALTAVQLTTLRAVADRVVPQEGPPLDLAARVDDQLARGAGDGWRFDDLPPDAEAYAAGLDALAGFAELSAPDQDARLGALAAGRDGLAMTHWFEDARTDLVRAWVAHPATMARIGYDGFATGSDGDRLTGFAVLGAGQHEAWEPTA